MPIPECSVSPGEMHGAPPGFQLHHFLPWGWERAETTQGPALVEGVAP